MEEPISAVIFDFDGTLVRSSIDFSGMRERVVALARSRSLPVPGRRRPVLELIDEIGAGGRSKQRAGFVRAARAVVEREEIAAEAGTVPVPGAADLSRRLRRAGIKVGIISRNCRACVERLLRKHRFVYDALVSRDDVARVKPHPDHIHRVLALLGVPADRTAVVGDHPFDIRGARAAGTRSVAVLSGGASRAVLCRERPDIILPDVTALSRYLGLEPLRAGKLPNPFLEYLLARYPAGGRGVLLGPRVGMDCALFRPRADRLAAGSDPITLVGRNIGVYLVDINANDLAVMGAIPGWLLATLLFPVGTTLPAIEQVYAEIAAECRRLGIAWIGGHTEISPVVTTPVAGGCLLGRPGARSWRPRRVRPGDSVLLIRPIGIEAASVIARLRPEEIRRRFGPRFLAAAERSLRKPGVSVVRVALETWRRFDVLAMHDPTEGGLAEALHETATAYGVGFRVRERELPVFRPTATLARHFGLSPLGVISSGCLLVIVRSTEAPAVERFWRRKKESCRVIGEVMDGRAGVVLERAGGPEPFPRFPRDEVTRLTGETLC